MTIRASENKPVGRVRDAAYLVAIHLLPCVLAGPDCAGPIEADHVGDRPLGRKSNDDETIPLCRRHHAQRHAMAGPFKTWNRQQMRAWKREMVRAVRLALRVRN